LDWKGKKVLVTGAGGFIGSHLTERLVALGAHVRAMIHYNALGGCGWLDRSHARDHIEVVAGDICVRDSVVAAMKDVEIVYHLAALIGIPYSYLNPGSYLRTNVEGTLNVLQAARKWDVQRLIHTSTSEVYGTARYAPIDENHPLQGQSPYSASKIGADKIAEAFFFSFDVPGSIARPFNTFGPRQSNRAVIPTIISQCLERKRVVLGSLDPTRDFNYVENTVEGFVAIASSSATVGKTINLGSGREITIGALATLIADLTGCKVSLDTDAQRIRPDQSEVKRLVADNTLARSLLSWEPAVSLENGLRTTIEWIRTYGTRSQPDEYSV